MFYYIHLIHEIVSVLTGVLCVTDAVNVTQPPQNVTALAGDNVTLNCTVQGAVYSFFWQINVEGGIYVYSLSNGVSPIWGQNIDTTKFQQVNSYGLAINNVSITDGSVYKCSSLDNSFARSAVVIVTRKCILCLNDGVFVL